VERLTKNVGTAIGLELRDTTQQLNATNTRSVKAGMTFNVAVGEWQGHGRLGGRRPGGDDLAGPGGMWCSAAVQLTVHMAGRSNRFVWPELYAPM